MNNKFRKILTTLFVVMLMFILSACGGPVLKDNERSIESSNNNPPVLDQDYCVGFVAYICVDDSCPIYYSLLEKAVDQSLDIDSDAESSLITNDYKQPFEYYKDDNQMVYIGSTNFQSGKMFGDYVKLSKLEAMPSEEKEQNASVYFSYGNGIIFSDSKVSKTNAIGEDGGSLEIEVTLRHTYLLQNAVIVPLAVMCKREDGTLYTNGTESGSTLSMFGNASTTFDRTLSTTKTLDNGEKEATYKCLLKINHIAVDYLTNAKIIEMSADNTVINTSIIGEEQESYQTGNSTDYVIIEKTYKKYNSDCAVVKEYVNRQIVNKSEYKENRMVDMCFPLENGLVRNYELLINFSE